MQMTLSLLISLLRKYCKLKRDLICSIEILEALLILEVRSSIYLELKVAINSLGIEAKAQAVYQMIAELDKDGSGQI
jgi:hypothetical protein